MAVAVMAVTWTVQLDVPVPVLYPRSLLFASYGTPEFNPPVAGVPRIEGEDVQVRYTRLPRRR